MLTVTVNENLIIIPANAIGCCLSEFDSTYPIGLRGIIEPKDFQQSINHINRVNSSRRTMIIFAVNIVLFIVIGFALCIISGVTVKNTNSTAFRALLGTGLGFIGFAGVLSICGCLIVRTHHITQLYEAINYESEKYSRQVPISCSWQLCTSKIRTRSNDNHRIKIPYRIIIQIKRSNENIPHQYRSISPEQIHSNISELPPSYDTIIMHGICDNCGMLKENFNARFCSSCGQPFNI